MKLVNVKPVQVIGDCPVELGQGDEFQVDGMLLKNPAGKKVCILAVSQLMIGQGIWQLQSGERFFSHVTCPGCMTEPDQENRVVFLLCHADKQELGQNISDYLRLCKQKDEPEAARLLKEEAIMQQSKGNYAEAARIMRSALQALEQAGS